MPRSIFRLVVLLSVMAGAVVSASAQAYTTTETLYSFPSPKSGPTSALIQGSDGNFYGTSDTAIYKYVPTLPGFAAPPQPLITLHSDGSNSADEGGYSSLIEGLDGNFYGVTPTGGANGYGQVFRLTPNGTYTSLYSFCNVNFCADGTTPVGPLVQGSDGNFYGVTSAGGSVDSEPGGYGTFFRLTPGGSLTTLYTFGTGANAYGTGPQGALLQGNDGNFYGTTPNGGFYQLTPSGGFTSVNSFCGPPNCYFTGNAFGQIAEDASHNYYGFSSGGGEYSDGVMFETNSTGAENIEAFNFCNETFDCTGEPLINSPASGIFLASNSLLYFASEYGGSNNYAGTVSSEGGALYNFCAQDNCADGMFPNAPVQGNDGALYGTVSAGGANGYGGIYRIQLATTTAPSLPSPVELSATEYNLLVGQPTTLTWDVRNGTSTTMQQCSAWLNDESYGKIETSGSITFTPTVAGTYTPAITCGGIETGFATLVVTSKRSATATTLAASATSLIDGDYVALTAQVSKSTALNGIPRGTVSFQAGSVLIGTATVNQFGSAILYASSQNVPAGTYPVTATYNGDGGDLISTSSPVTITVSSQPTTVAFYAQPNPVPAGQSVEFTVYVQAAYYPTGTVSVTSEGVTLGTITLIPSSSPANGFAGYGTLTVSTQGVPAGKYQVTASYGGDVAHLPSTGTTTMTVE